MVDFVSLDREIVIDNNNNKLVIDFRLLQHHNEEIVLGWR